MARFVVVRRCVALMLLGAFLLQLARVGAQIVEEELTEEQIEYYRSVLETYDTNHDGFISMEENLEQDKIIAEESGKPFDEYQSRVSFEQSDSNKDGFVTLEEMTEPRPPEEKCKQLYGEHAEFDGVKSCRCVKGFTADINGTCIQGSNEVCVKQFGPLSMFDGSNNCQCKNGTIPNVNGTCIEGNDAACQEQFGEHARFSVPNSTCVCEKGSVPDTNGTCVPASNELCQEWFGPNTAFDGENSCVCRKGFVYADGECFRGSNKICGSIIAGSRFDGNNNCKCRKGYEIDEARGMCVRVDPAKGGQHLKPLYKEGTVTVTVVEAKHLPKMDKHTKCDPFVTMLLGNTTKRTRVVKKTYRPNWEETFVFSYNETSERPTDILFEVWDWDRVGKEFIGRVELSLYDLLDDEISGWVDIHAGDGALVRGHDKNVSSIHLQVTYTEGLPHVPFWEPILEDRPEWVLSAVRGAVAAWMAVGFLLFFVLNREGKADETKDKTE